jgi:hypothetical protein
MPLPLMKEFGSSRLGEHKLESEESEQMITHLRLRKTRQTLESGP